MLYDPRYHQRTSNLEDEIAGYAEDALVVKQQRTNRPARHLGNTKQAIIAERLARQQAIDEVRARQRNGRSTRRPTDAYPKVRQRPVQQEDDEVERDEVYEDEDLSTKAPRSAVRYQPEEVYRQGNTQVNKYTSPPPANPRHAIPPRRSKQPPAQRYQQEQYTNDVDEEVERPGEYRRRIHLHWLVFAGVGLLLMLAGWMALNDLGAWWQNHQDDAAYGMPRTYQTDAVVGHNDSSSNPSHFIAINLRGSIYILEAPGGNFSKSRSYFITTEVGGNPHPPVTIKFQDLTHSGRLDMVVTIGDPPTPLIVFLFNNGSQFLAKSQ